jgi:hypothetical protein
MQEKIQKIDNDGSVLEITQMENSLVMSMTMKKIKITALHM